MCRTLLRYDLFAFEILLLVHSSASL
jgi:hypothetical protein